MPAQRLRLRPTTTFPIDVPEHDSALAHGDAPRPVRGEGDIPDLRPGHGEVLHDGARAVHEGDPSVVPEGGAAGRQRDVTGHRHVTHGHGHRRRRPRGNVHDRRLRRVLVAPDQRRGPVLREVAAQSPLSHRHSAADPGLAQTACRVDLDQPPWRAVAAGRGGHENGQPATIRCEGQLERIAAQVLGDRQLGDVAFLVGHLYPGPSALRHACGDGPCVRGRDGAPVPPVPELPRVRHCLQVHEGMGWLSRVQVPAQDAQTRVDDERPSGVGEFDPEQVAREGDRTHRTPAVHQTTEQGVPRHRCVLETEALRGQEEGQVQGTDRGGQRRQPVGVGSSEVRSAASDAAGPIAARSERYRSRRAPRPAPRRDPPPGAGCGGGLCLTTGTLACPVQLGVGTGA